LRRKYNGCQRVTVSDGCSNNPSARPQKYRWDVCVGGIQVATTCKSLHSLYILWSVCVAVLLQTQHTGGRRSCELEVPIWSNGQEISLEESGKKSPTGDFFPEESAHPAQKKIFIRCGCAVGLFIPDFRCLHCPVVDLTSGQNVHSGFACFVGTAGLARCCHARSQGRLPEDLGHLGVCASFKLCSGLQVVPKPSGLAWYLAAKQAIRDPGLLHGSLPTCPLFFCSDRQSDGGRVPCRYRMGAVVA
jgi:hypothetical protein